MTPPLAEAPDELNVVFDMHGIRCELRPRATRPRWLQITLMISAALVTTGAIVAFLGGITTLVLYGGLPAMAVTGAALLVLLGLLGIAVVDGAEQLDHYNLRLGEGWLVLRFADQGSEIRFDLREIAGTRIDAPDIRLRDKTGEEAVIPMGGHTAKEVLWLASAIDLAVVDARTGDEPAPASLLALLAHNP